MSGLMRLFDPSPSELEGRRADIGPVRDQRPPARELHLGRGGLTHPRMPLIRRAEPIAGTVVHIRDGDRFVVQLPSVDAT
jgi:hypothetical protein